MASARVCIWASQKVTSASTALLEVSSNHVMPMHPVWAIASRRFQNAPFSIQHYHANPPLQRWKRNFSKLYARRILELAIASAATRRFITEMEDVIEGDIHAKPADWKNWERKDCEDELLASLGTSKISRFWSAATRIFSLTCLVTPLVVLYPLTYVSESAGHLSWSYALWGIEQAGPTYLKLAQWATSRHDLFSPEFCQYFGKLQDDTIGHSWKETQRLLKQEFGNVADHIELDKEPIGSGCIAQVYRGYLTKASGQYPMGTEVAVKVQHPGIWGKVCVDFYLMGKVARFLEGIPGLNLRYLSLNDSVTQFRDIMLPQLDLTIEAKNLQRFNRDFSDDKRVSFPYPLHGLTTEKVLTETFIHGKPILEFAKEEESSKKDLAYLGE
jgi:hypothetical protein